MSLSMTPIRLISPMKMRLLLILKICSAITTSPFLGSVGLTSWDRSETPVLEYRKRVAKRGPGLALFAGSDNVLRGEYQILHMCPLNPVYTCFIKEKVDKMCQRSSAIIALISCNVYCDNNPECQLEAVQLCFHGLWNEDVRDVDVLWRPHLD